MARTGSGKTCAFLLPLLEKLLSTPKGVHGNHVRGIVLSPTRELSAQTLKVLQKLCSGTDIHAVGIHGGEGMEKQFNLLASKPDVICASPGRLAHHLSEIPDFHLGGCFMCILDEADRLLEMGFAMQIRQIARSLPDNCQKVMLSATMPKILVEFTKSGFAVDPAVVRLDQEASVSAELRIAFVTCRSLDKDASLLHIVDNIRRDQKQHEATRTGLTLIFAATRHHVDYIATLLQASGTDATMIYGTMDQEARQENLAAFRSGEKPVLVVTDVAARGIDVPLIDHVIHYHFPPSPKLFVHRSGRAARAGRIGYCWGLVEPDELPYMIELHLFLGRKPATSVQAAEDGTVTELSYSLDEMTPEMVHYGSLPESILTAEVENVQRIRNSEMCGSMEAEQLRALSRVCTNAMKQYRRTRPEASREAVRRAKAILEGERMDTGERVGGGMIPSHPLLRRMEADLQKKNPQAHARADALKAREEFLQAVSQFRPKETVFEAFATGKSKDAGVVSHLDRGRTTSNKKNDSTAALSAMKNMRRQMRIARDKGTTLVVAGSEAAQQVDAQDVEEDRDDENDVMSDAPKPAPTAPVVAQKRRLSKAERKRLKKDPKATVADPPSVNKKEVKRDFRDPDFYMENDHTSNTEEAKRSRQIEAAMQPSAANMKGSMGNALRMEEAMLDIVGDENESFVKKQRMMRWDKAKRKYVQTTVGAELSGDSKSKRTRVESGQMVKSDRMKLGELYEKWQKKTSRSIGRDGVFDNESGLTAVTKKGKKGASTKTKVSKSESRKSVDEIQKARAKKKDMQLKNMKKSDRRKVERKQGSNRPRR